MKKYLTLDRIILAILLILCLGIVKCQNDKIIEAKTVITDLDLKSQKLDSIKNKYGETILIQYALVTSSQKSIRQLTDTIFNLKKAQEKQIKNVIAYYSNVTSTGIKNHTIPYLDTAKMKRFEDSVERVCASVIKYYRDSSVEVPKDVKDSSKNFVFSGTVLKDSFQIKKIEFPDSMYLRFVEKKGGMFKRQSVEVQMFHTNPNIKVLNSNSILYKPPTKLGIVEKLTIFAIGIFLGLKI